jgi:hypothetical protein
VEIIMPLKNVMMTIVEVQPTIVIAFVSFSYTTHKPPRKEQSDMKNPI